MFTLGLVDSDITSCPASIAIWKAHILSANNTFAVLKICPLAEEKFLYRDWSPKFATGLNVIIGIKKYMSDQTVFLPKWCTPRGIILAKGQLGHSYTF